MCGILGMAFFDKEPPGYKLAADLRNLTKHMLVNSRVRGSDASGVCVLADNRASMFKLNIPSDDLVKESDYSYVISRISYRRRLKSVIGHTRARTKGDQKYNVNNHPIRAGRVIGVHNGVIGNDEFLFNKYKGVIDRKGRVDSEVIFQLINYHTATGKSLSEATQSTCAELVGSFACAFIHLDWPDYLTVFTNGSSIPMFIFDEYKTMIFASTQAIVRQSMAFGPVIGKADDGDMLTISRDQGARINLTDGKIYKFELERSPNMHLGYGMCGY